MVLDGYRAYSHPSASGGQYVGLQNSPDGLGTVTYAFEGSSGTYDLEISIYDENDGTSSFAVFINDDFVGNYLAQEDLQTGGIGRRNLTSFTLEGLAINQGDSIRIAGAAEGGEFARIDKLEFTPVVPVTPTPTPTPTPVTPTPTPTPTPVTPTPTPTPTPVTPTPTPTPTPVTPTPTPTPTPVTPTPTPTPTPVTPTPTPTPTPVTPTPTRHLRR